MTEGYITGESPMIRVCYVATSAGDWGGASRSLFLLLKKINRRKISPFVLFPGEGSLTEEMAKRDIPYLIWGGMHEFNGLIQYIKDIANAVKLFKSEKIDILHINYSTYWRPAEIVAAKILKIPIITHYRVITKQPGPFVKYSNLIIANSEYTRDASLSHGVKRVAIHNIVDTERYDSAISLREELNIGLDKIVISFLGQIKKIKGKGLMAGVEFEFEVGDLRKRLIYDHHIFTGGAMNKKLLRILPPLTVKKENIDTFINALKEVLS